jgi:hypothetical protein
VRQLLPDVPRFVGQQLWPQREHHTFGPVSTRLFPSQATTVRSEDARSRSS